MNLDAAVTGSKLSADGSLLNMAHGSQVTFYIANQLLEMCKSICKYRLKFLVSVSVSDKIHFQASVLVSVSVDILGIGIGIF